MPADRRSFLSRLAAAGGAAAAAFTAPRALAAQAAPRDDSTRHPRDQWLDDLPGKHRQVYDCTTAKSVPWGLGFANNFVMANQSGYGLKPEEVGVLVSYRHAASAFAFDDHIWARYEVGKRYEVEDPQTKAPATRNIHAATMRSRASQGIRFSVCGLSTGRYASEFARSTNQAVEAVRAELEAHLAVPGTVIVPAGVVVVNRAQERGYSYVFVGEA
jgi:intracellular sulfur oxidation DsrE/DsrF family protein